MPPLTPSVMVPERGRSVHPPFLSLPVSPIPPSTPPPFPPQPPFPPCLTPLNKGNNTSSNTSNKAYLNRGSTEPSPSTPSINAPIPFSLSEANTHTPGHVLKRRRKARWLQRRTGGRTGGRDDEEEEGKMSRLVKGERRSWRSRKGWRKQRLEG